MYIHIYIYVAAFVNLIFMFSRMQVHYSKVLSFETCTADIFITWKKRDANKATWPFGHSQISSERAAEHFLEFYIFKFQKTNGSSMYWIHVSYWGHIRNTISYIQLTQLGTVSPHFWCLGSHHHRQRDTRRNPHRDITRSTCFSRGCTSASSMRFWTCGETLPGMTLWFHVWLPTKSNVKSWNIHREWRCMSYWKWGFCNGMLVNSKVYCINRYEQIWRMWTLTPAKVNMSPEMGPCSIFTGDMLVLG